MGILDFLKDKREKRSENVLDKLRGRLEKDSNSLMLDFLLSRLLMDVAFADMDISEAERNYILSFLYKRGYGEKDAAVIVETAEEDAKKGMGVFKTAEKYSRLTDIREREAALRTLFETAASGDDTVCGLEEDVIAKISDILKIPRSVFIDIKLEFKDKLPYLKKIENLKNRK